MPTAKFDLPECILVSGAAGGIGGAVARQLATAGSTVLGTDRDDMPPGWRGQWIVADLATSGAHQTIADAVTAPLGGLVFAAGILDPDDWQAVDQEAAARLLAVNLTAPFFVLRSLLPALSDGASVVIVGSVAGSRASPATPLYAASKAGLRNLASSLALLVQPRGIRINVVAPGLVDTPLTDKLDGVLAARQDKSIELVKADRAAAIPLGRPGSVDEIASACLYLLSAQSSYLTGSTIFATGGVLAGST